MPARVLSPNKLRNNKRGKIVIINYQKTHLDKKCKIKIHYDCDVAMKMLCEKLKIDLFNDITNNNNDVKNLNSSIDYYFKE
jgi:NAD-dependent SIR2 family protein deacetylase